MPMPEREQEQEPLRQQKIVDFMLGDSGVLAEQRLPVMVLMPPVQVPSGVILPSSGSEFLLRGGAAPL